MRLRINIYIVASIAFSIITLVSFWAFSSLFAETSIFYIGLPCALSAFLFSYMLLRHNSVTLSFKIAHAQIPNIILCVITILSVLAVLFVPAYDGSILEWVNIPLMNWLRYAASTLLTLFLPGYFLLKIFDSRNSLELSAIIPFSYVLSMFITFVTGFCLLLMYNSISSLVSFLLIGVNLTLMVAYCVLSSLNHRSTTVVNLSLTEVGALLATLAVILVGSIYVMNSTLPLSLGDMWVHLAGALQYSKGFPVYGGMLMPNYPYLFYVYLATLFQLSGLPSAISYQALFALSFISVLSFYSFVKGWFSKKNVVSIAVLLVSLLGFGSLYTLNLKVQNPAMSLSSAVSNAIPKTYDISDIMVIGPVLSNVVPILFIALPTLFMFLYLLRKNVNSITKSFLCAALVAVSFLGHPDASFFMGLALLLYAVIMKGDGVRSGSLGGIVGLLIVTLVDVSAPARMYIWGLGVSSAITLTFFVTFLFFVLSYVYSFLIRHVKIKRNFFSNGFKKNTFPIISWGIIGAYFFVLITWLYVLPRYNAYVFGGSNFTPFFVWAIRFGPIGLFSILCLSLYLGDVIKDKRLIFFAAIASAGFVMEQLTNYFPVYAAYRFATLTLIGVVPLAAYFVVKSFSLLTGKKKIVLTAILLLIMLPGMFSTSLFYYSEGQLKPTINNYELAALAFIEKNPPSNSSVITFTSDSESKLETFTGVNPLQIMQTWDYLLLNNTDPSTLLYLLGTSNAKYVYLSTSDFEELNSSNSTLRVLLDYLPVAFQNEDVTIYEVPQIAPPSLKSNLNILNFLTPDTTEFENDPSQSGIALQAIPSILNLNYTISSVPIEENITSFAIKGLNSSNWVTTEGTGAPFLDEKDLIDGSAAIAVNNLTTNENGYFAISNYCPVVLTQFDSLQVPLKVSDDVLGEVKLILYDPNGSYAAWLIQNFPKNQWFTMTVPLTEPTLESTTPIDLGNVSQIKIGFQELNPDSTYSFLKIGNVTGVISSYFLPYDEVKSLLPDSSTIMLTQDPNFDASSLLQSAEAGDKIVVFDTDNNNEGFFFNFLQLVANGYVQTDEIALSTNVGISETQVPFISTNSSSISCISYYKLNGSSVAPFVLFEKVGVGSITYVILPSTIITTLKNPLASLANIFDKIAEMQEFPIEKSEYSPNFLGSYDTLEGAVNVTGQFKVHTDHMLNISPITSSRLEITTENISKILTNTTIDSLEIYGSVQLVMAGQSISMQANSVSSYLTIFGDGLNQSCILELSDGTVADLSISNSTGLFTLQMKGGSLLIDTSELNVLVRNPSIESQGDTYFKSARIEYANPYTPLAGAVRQPLKIDGQAIFTVPFTNNDVMIITGFSYDGAASSSQVQTVARFEVPWLDLLMSPTSFVFYLILLVFAVFLFMRKQFSGVENGQD